MNVRKKCLVLTFQTPRKPGGGEVRSWCLLKTACEVFDVTILNVGGMTGDGRVPEEIRCRCSMVIEPGGFGSPPAAIRRTGRMVAWLSLLGALLFPWRDFGRPFLRLMLQYDLSNDPGIAARLVRMAVRCWTPVISLMPITCFMFDQSWRRIREASIAVATRERFDIFWVEHTLAWPFAEELLELNGIRDAEIVCSAQNIEHRVCERQRDVAVDAVNASYYDRQARQMKRLELRTWRRADLVLQCSEADAEATKRHSPGARVEVIGNGVDGGYFQPIAAPFAKIEPIILYTAGFGYAPNAEAVRWFLQHVFPLVREMLPQVRFLFAGLKPSDFRRLCRLKTLACWTVWNGSQTRPIFDRHLVVASSTSYRCSAAAVPA